MAGCSFFQPAAHGGFTHSANSTQSSRSIWEQLTHKSSEIGVVFVFLSVLHLMDLHPFSSSTSSTFQCLPSWELHILVRWGLSKMFLVFPPRDSHSYVWPPMSGSFQPSANLLLGCSCQHKTSKFLLSAGRLEGASLGLCFCVWTFLNDWVSKKISLMHSKMHSQRLRNTGSGWFRRIKKK